MASSIKWQTCSGAVLLNAVESNEPLNSYISSGGGIYFWKVRFRPEAWERSDAKSMVTWIDRLMTGIRGSSQTKALSHILQIPRVEIRGRKLTTEQSQYLSEFLKSSRSRRWVAEYVESLEDFAPTLYVGETDNLRRRAAQHIRHFTDFGLTVQESDELSWEHLNFHYTVLSDFGSRPEKLRKSLEYLSAALTIAGLTKRPG